MFRKTSEYKKCPRCNFKTFRTAKTCGNCELNFEKFSLATNAEGKNALKKREKDRVVMTSILPSDLNKWNLFFYTLLLGWSGAHLWKVGKFNRAIAHTLGLFFMAVYCITTLFEVNNFWYNVGNILGVFWLITFILTFVDMIQIAFNAFKVPVSLPYSKNKE